MFGIGGCEEVDLSSCSIVDGNQIQSAEWGSYEDCVTIVRRFDSPKVR